MISAIIYEQAERGLRPLFAHLTTIRDLGRDPTIDDAERGRRLRKIYSAPEPAKVADR